MSTAATATESSITLPSAEDLDTGHWGSRDSRTRTLYLDPENCRIIDFDSTGSEVPTAAWHRRIWPILSYGAATSGDSVVDELEAMRDELEALANAYLGAEWNGNNMVGRWDEDATDAFDRYVEETPIELTTYCDAADWFGDEDPRDEILDLRAAGKTDAEIAAHYVAAASPDVALCQADVLDWIASNAMAVELPPQSAWVTPPECQGQIVVVSYADHVGYVWRKVFDQGDRSLCIYRMDWDNAEFALEGAEYDPANAEPAIDPDDVDWNRVA